jgi:dipeptidyl aminopeptidase/acylaminoacyl peptidase
MHGNSSARVEVIPQLSYLLSLGLAVFSFDFAGSGKSDGDYVSLGYYEREDLMSVIAHLRATNVVSTIALWGRSMGAATALMHGDRDPSIACMVLDSPFADLTQLAEEMVEKGKEQGINVPNFIVSFAIRCIQASVKRQANFNIRDISPIAHADKCFIPALFVAGEHDDFIHKRHSQAIHDRYAGDKNIIVVEGDHNSPRPKFMFDSVSIFLQTCLQIPSAWALKIHHGMNLMAPPWF